MTIDKKVSKNTFLVEIFKNLCYMKLRSKKENVDIHQLHEVLENKNINQDIEDRIVLKAAFSVINDEERNIIMLHAVSGLKHREIAKMLNLPLSTVLSKYNRAIKKLKKQIKKEDMK